MKKKWLVVSMSLIVALGLMTACGGGGDKAANSDASQQGTEQKSEGGDEAITASGSSALLPLAKDAAKAFKEENANVAITINGGGSGNGLKQVSDGAVDIGNSDVAAEEKLEPEKAKELVDHKVCVITMVPVVNKDLAKEVESLTKKQIIDVFTGKITNWKEVGGPDEPVVLVTRPKTSGTRVLFEKYGLDGQSELDNQSLETDDSGTLLQTVSDQKGAIGYVAMSYLVNNDKVAALGIDGVKPSLEATYEGKWPIWGYEHMYTKGEPGGAVKEYLDFVMGEKYADRLEKQGYNVTSKMKVER